MPKPTAIIADDHTLIRQGIRQILLSAGLEVVEEAADGLEAVALVRKFQPTLMTLDIAMPYARGIEVFGEVRRWSPDTKIMVFSGMTSAGLFRELAQAQANGIFLKRGELETFAEAIPRVLAGELVISKDVSRLLEAAPDQTALTIRERQILSLVAQGLSNKEIGVRLGVSNKTADNHRTNLMKKVGAHSVAELLAFALREGLLEAHREL